MRHKDLSPLVALWYLKDPGVLTQRQQGYCQSLLTPNEQERYGKMSHEERRRFYLLGHTLARHQLAQYLDCNPSEVPLVFGDSAHPYQAPYLDGANSHVGQGWHTSITHTQGLLAVACAPMPVGVDAENTRVRKNKNFDLIAGDFPEYSDLQALPTELAWDSYYKLFSLKEAFHKATQYGFLKTQSNVRFAVDAANQVIWSCVDLAELERFKGIHCQLAQPTPDHVLSLAYDRQGIEDSVEVPVHKIEVSLEQLLLLK